MHRTEDTLVLKHPPYPKIAAATLFIFSGITYLNSQNTIVSLGIALAATILLISKRLNIDRPIWILDHKEWILAPRASNTDYIRIKNSDIIAVSVGGDNLQRNAIKILFFSKEKDFIDFDTRELARDLNLPSEIYVLRSNYGVMNRKDLIRKINNHLPTIPLNKNRLSTREWVDSVLNSNP